MKQAELFRPASRTSDPPSSHEAEEAVTASGERARQAGYVYQAIMRFYYPARERSKFAERLSFTAGELAQHMAKSGHYWDVAESESLLHFTVCRRLPDLRSQGKVYNKLEAKGGRMVTAKRICSARGGSAQMWWLA
jgi:hypothetical protein